MATGYTTQSTGTAGSTYLSNINAYLLEVMGSHAGASEPTNKTNGMLWLDTTNKQLKIWDSGNAAWRVIVDDYEVANGGVAMLSGATFTAATAGVAATGDTHFPVSSQVNALVQSMTMEITFANSSHNRFLWAIPASARYGVTGVYVISDTATTSSDGTNNWTFQVQNLTAANSLCSTAKTTNGAEIAGDTRYSLGVDQNNAKADLDGGDVLELQITKNGTPTDLSSARVTIQIDYTVAMY